MSVFSAVATLAGGQLEDVLLRQGRSINGIIPQVIIEEQHRDEMAITVHPVQNGAAITDHAYKQPSTVAMRCGWSQSGSLFDIGAGGEPLTDVRSIYQMLIDLQASRQPLDLVTGKRTYTDMLIRSLDVVTDMETENALIVEAVFQQIIMVDVQTATLPPSSSMASPASTAPVSNTGTQQPNPVPESLLFKAGSVLGPILGGG